MRFGEHDRLVPLAFANGLVGTHFVEPLAVDPPTSLVELKNGGCMPGGMGELEGSRVEVNADQRKQTARLPIARPENIIVPVGRFPPFAEAWIGLAENGDEPCFKPLAVLVKQKPRVIDMHILDDLANRPTQYQPSCAETNRQDAGPDEISHDRIPGDLPE
jgi:hypothetical protein